MVSKVYTLANSLYTDNIPEASHCYFHVLFRQKVLRMNVLREYSQNLLRAGCPHVGGKTACQALNTVRFQGTPYLYGILRPYRLLQDKSGFWWINDRCIFCYIFLLILLNRLQNSPSVRPIWQAFFFQEIKLGYQENSQSQ